MFSTRLVTAALLTVFTLTSLAATVPVKIAPRPAQAFKVKKAIDANFADPAFTIFNGTWYAYATTGNGVNAQVATSKDGDDWTLLRGLEALPNPGKWVDQSRRGVWAPDVVVAGNGKYVMYYSAKLPGLHRHCVGAAVADAPTGPFRAQDAPFACPAAAGFRDAADGRRYVVYKVDGNSIGGGGNCNNGVRPIVPTPIMLQQVGPADALTRIGAPVPILNRDPADGPLVEAPSLTRTADGKYVLFYSSNCYSGARYDIAYAFADRVAGPYTKAARFAVTGMGGLYAPGGADVSPDGKRMVFHAANGKGGRGMFTARIAFDSKRMLVSTV